MKHLTLIVPFLLTALAMQAQSGFEKVYGGTAADRFTAVTGTSDGGILAGGSTRSFGNGNAYNTDAYLLKMDAGGDTLWSRTFGGSYDDRITAVAENNMGYIVVAYYYTDTPSVAAKFHALQYDANGNLLWEQSYGSSTYEYTTDVILDHQGRNVLCGGYYNAAGNYDFALVKTDAAGNELAETTIGGTGYDWPYALIQTSDGGYAIIGYSNSDLTQYDLYLAKTDSNLQLQWTRHYGSTADDYGYDLAEDPAGNLWLLGSMAAPDSAGMVLIETDAGGDNAIMAFPGSHPGDFGYKIQSVSGGGFLVGGVTANYAKGNEMLLEKLDAGGDTLWTHHFGGAQGEFGYAVATDIGGNILLAGETEGFGVSQADGYLVKTDGNGNVPCPSLCSFIATPDPVCEDEYVTLTNTTISSQLFTWSEAGSTFSNEVNTQRYFSDAGLHAISLSACGATAVNNITVNAKPATSFTYTHSGSTVSFMLAPGLAVQSIRWDFGDGTPQDTVNANPVHGYADLGMYWVTCAVTDTNGCDSTYTEQINLLTGTGDKGNEALTVFPNPAHESFSVNENRFPAHMQLLTLQGVTLHDYGLQAGAPLALPPLPAGLYLLRITTGNRVRLLKLDVN